MSDTKELSIALMKMTRALGDMLRANHVKLDELISHMKSVSDIYNELFPVTHITLIKEDKPIEEYRPGDMGRTSHYGEAWTLCCPRGCGMVASLANHQVVEHGDETISIDYLWHGCTGFSESVRFEIDHNRIVYLDKEEQYGKR